MQRECNLNLFLFLLQNCSLRLFTPKLIQNNRVQPPRSFLPISLANLRLPRLGLLRCHHDRTVSSASSLKLPQTFISDNDNDNHNHDIEQQEHQHQQQQQRPKPISKSPSAVQEKKPARYWQNVENRRKFFDEAAKQLGYSQLDDWYQCNTRMIRKLGGMAILNKYYDSSLFKALSELYPEHEWNPWQFKTVPVNLWKDINNHKRFFEWARTRLGVKELDDWYDISRQDIANVGGAALLNNYYNGTLSKALSMLYPEHNWVPWRFKTVVRWHWRELSNRRRFFDEVGKRLGIQQLDDWYKITAEHIRPFGGDGFINRYHHGSIYHALSAAYPEHEWLPWRFPMVPQGFWNDKSNQRRFFEWAAKQLGLEDGNLDEWYRVTQDDLTKLGGGGLLAQHYDGSHSKALAALYPEHEWLPWRFSVAPRGFWLNHDNCRAFLNYAAKKLNVQNCPEDWYRITQEQIAGLGGRALLFNHDNSLAKVLSVYFPEVRWEPWRFPGFTNQSPFLHDETVLRRYVEFIARELHVEQFEEWYRVSLLQIRRLGGFALLASNGGLLAVLKKLYPEHAWDEARFEQHSSKRSTQRWLRVAVQQMFPNEEVFEEYWHQQLKFPGSGQPMTLDVYVPSISLAFEYQGAQHYRDLHMFGNASMTKARDAQKAAACAEAGITLVIVPYWWDRSTKDLVASICAVRPDLAESLLSRICTNAYNDNDNDNSNKRSKPKFILADFEEAAGRKAGVADIIGEPKTTPDTKPSDSRQQINK